MSENYIIQEWANEAKTNIYLGKKDYENKTLYLYSENPGHLIGYHGERVERYREKLRAFGWAVSIIEIQEVFCPNKNYDEVLYNRMKAYFDLEGD